MPGDYCDTVVDGGVCKPAYTVTFVAPVPNALVDGGSHNATVQVDVAPASAFAQPAAVALGVGCVDGGSPLLQTGNMWSGSWSPRNKDETLALCAQAYLADGGRIPGLAQTSVTVDVMPPTLSPQLSRQPANASDPSGLLAFARDEDPVQVNPGASDNSAFTVTYTLTADGGPVPGIEGNGLLMLQTPPLAERAIYSVNVTATDAVGNTSTATVPVPVTRWKWVATLPVSTSSLGNPAVGRDGTIYEVVTAVNGAAPKNVFAINPDGTTKWSATVPATPIAGAALAQNAGVLFVLDNQEMSILYMADGGAVHAPFPIAGPSAPPAPEFSVGRSSGLEVAFVAGTSSNSRLTAFGADGTSSPSFALGASFTGNYVADDFIHVGEAKPASNQVQSFQFASGSFMGLDAGQIGDSLNAGPYGDSNEMFLSAGGGSKIVHVDLSQPSPVESPSAVGLTNSVSGEVLIPASRKAIVAVKNTDIEEVGVAATMVASPLATVRGETGMLLATNSLYALSGAAASCVPYASASSGTLSWQIDLSQVSPSTAATAAPSLTCSAHGTSWLLVPTNGKLVALVIDEAGLNTAAPWPKARRDLANTANAALPLQACP